MGIFSFMFANKPNRNLRYGEKGILLLPDGRHITTNSYDCYGHFGNDDVFEKMFWFNRNWIINNVKKQNIIDKMMWKNATKFQRILDDVYSFEGTEEEFYDEYGDDVFDTLRDIMIYVFHNEPNHPYPIKIVDGTCKVLDYSLYPASKYDEEQGREPYEEDAEVPYERDEY